MSIDENSLRYDELLEHYKKELAHFQFVRKKEMILKLAKKLQEAGTPDHLISSILINDLRGYDINKDYVARVLPEEFRDSAKKREKFADQKSADDYKIPIELSTSGQPLTQVESQSGPTEPKPESEFVILPEDEKPDETIEFWKGKAEEFKMLAERRGEQMEEQKQQVTELVTSINAMGSGSGNSSSNKDIKDSLEYKALESEIYLLQQERDELKQIATKQIKEHPEQTFQTASTIQAKPENTGKLNGEVEFPAKDLSTMFLDSRNAKKCMFLTIKDSVVVAWQTDVRRNTAN